MNKCLHTVASSWTFLLTLNHDARNHELKKKKKEDKFVSLRSALPVRPCLGPEPAVGGPGKKKSLFLKQMLQYNTPGELKVELKFWTASCYTETMLTQLVAYLSAICCYAMDDIPGSSLSDVSYHFRLRSSFVCRVVIASGICVPSYGMTFVPLFVKIGCTK